MNELELLNQRVAQIYPDANTTITRPARRGGLWELDLRLADRHLVIEWSSASGFGISDASFETFGETSDERVDSLEDITHHIERLLAGNDRTSSPLPVLLSRLRVRQGFTQADLAEKLGVRQATVSGIERRSDVQMSTLKRLIEALGGVLEVWASFKEGRYRLDFPGIGGIQNPSVSESCRRQARASTDPDTAFTGLRQAGTLSGAMEKSAAISGRCAVLEMP